MNDLDKKKIIFVDDEHIICTMAEDIMPFFGFDIDVFEDSVRALEKFKENPHSYDIIVTDQSMPSINGFELLSQIIKIRADIPKILCTGYCDQFEELKKNEIGIDALYRKPYHFEDLIDEIRKLV